MWEVVNELTYIKKRNRTLPSKLINKDDTVITNHQTIADEFNKYFANVGKSIADLITPGSSIKSYSNSYVWSSNKAKNSIFLSPCSPPEVYNEIAKLKIKKALRTSDIETKFIKFSNPVISKFVRDLFNFCLIEGAYPDSLKVAEVIPISKKGEQDKTTNYRPITLLSQFNKIYEKLLYSRIYFYLLRYDLLSECQFGYRKNSSTNFIVNKICTVMKFLLILIKVYTLAVFS